MLISWYVMSCYDLDHPLILEVRGTSSVTWSQSVRNLHEIEQYPTELLVILQIYAHAMSRCDLDLWPIDLELLQHVECLAFIPRTNSERNRIICRWVTDDLARFRRAMVGHDRQTVLRSAWTQLHLTWRWHRGHIERSFLHKNFVSAFGYLAARSNSGGSKLSGVENDANFSLFDPLCEN